MKIIYFCYGGSHSSIAAAATHLGLLPLTGDWQGKQLLGLPYFDVQVASEHGRFQFMGTDLEGHQVYTIASRNLKNFVELVRGLAAMFSIPQEDLFIVSTKPCINWTMAVGGFLSRHWGIIWLGRPIVVWGTKKSFFSFVTLVGQVKAELPKTPVSLLYPGGSVK